MAKKTPAQKPKNYDRLSQKQKFIAAAKAADADETGAAFDRALSRIVPKKPGNKGDSVP
jgi:hypothetical protein